MAIVAFERVDAHLFLYKARLRRGWNLIPE